jgi:hypothetical protein
MKKNRFIFALVILWIATLACSGNEEPAVPVSPTEGSTISSSTENQAGEYETEFPMPGDVSNLTDTGNEAINFQTSTSLEDAIVFYRAEFSKAGYVERDINTAITETTFSMVFDGHANGKAIVIQGVDLGDGSTNISIRFEDI